VNFWVDSLKEYVYTCIHVFVCACLYTQLDFDKNYTESSGCFLQC
jgi:hypothetical protein